MKQLELLHKPSLQFGGSFDRRHRLRPLSSKKPIHLTLKSQKKFRLFRYREKIRDIFMKQADAFGIKIYTWSVQNDHIHLSLRIPCRNSYNKWIRATTGLIARVFGKGLWQVRPFTRLLSNFGKELINLNNYIFRNEMEVFRIWSYDRSISIENLARTTRGRLLYADEIWRQDYKSE